MKKTLVTLLAASTLAVAVAPIVSANNGAYSEIKTDRTPNVEQLSLEVSTKNVLYGQAWEADRVAGENVLGREFTLGATQQDLATAKQVVADAKVAKENLNNDYLNTLGLFGQGVVPAQFPTTGAVEAYYKPLLKAADDAIAAAEKDVVVKETAVAEAQKDLDAHKAIKAEAKKALDAAKVALDDAIARALAGGVTPAQVEEAKKGAVAAPAAKPAAGVKAAATPTGQKALPKTSAAK